jgi:hypothetical protein
MMRASIFGLAPISNERTSSLIGPDLLRERPCSCSSKISEQAFDAQNCSQIKLLQSFDSFLPLPQLAHHLVVPCGPVPLAFRG